MIRTNETSYLFVRIKKELLNLSINSSNLAMIKFIMITNKM